MKSVMMHFFGSMLAGFGLHQTASITHKIPEGWEQLSGTTIGVLGTFPPFLLWFRQLDGAKNIYVRAGAAFLLAFLGVGSGVALGWLIDTIFKINRE